MTTDEPTPAIGEAAAASSGSNVADSPPVDDLSPPKLDSDDDAAAAASGDDGANHDKTNASGSDVTTDDDDIVDPAEMKSDNNLEGGDDEEPPADATPDDLLLKAMTHKEDGNAHFKSGDYTAATRSYRRGTNALKNLNTNNTGDEQVKQLLITLQTNLSMVCYKQSKHKMSRDVASKALEIDSRNVKALYRRAVAHRAMGDADAARADLRTALKEDPNNVSVKKELLSIKKILEAQKAKEKARLQKAFSKKGGGSLLYSDKEEEEKRKEREAKEKEEREKEALELRKKEWEDECVRRMASDPPEEAISFDDWDKQRREKEEEAEKARKKARKAEEDRKREERRKAREAEKAANKNNNDDSDDDELTEKELAMLRGYKKTSDGRTTSYFNREQTEHEKNLIGCIKPKRLDEATTAPSPSSIAASLSSSGAAGPSVWNAAGTTWEEKDTTEWCKKALEKELLDTTTAYFSPKSADGTTYIACVKKVSDLTGDASVAIAGGKKRYIYDFHANVEYEIVDDGEAVIASGTLKLPEVHSANTSGDEEELEVQVMAWKKGPTHPPEGSSGVFFVEDCIECRKVLVQDVRKSVLRFVEKFNANF